MLDDISVSQVLFVVIMMLTGVEGYDCMQWTIFCNEHLYQKGLPFRCLSHKRIHITKASGVVFVKFSFLVGVAIIGATVIHTSRRGDGTPNVGDGIFK